MSGMSIEAASVILTLVISGISVIIYRIKFRSGKETFGWTEREEGEDEPRGKIGYNSAEKAIDGARKELGDE